MNQKARQPRKTRTSRSARPVAHARPGTWRRLASRFRQGFGRILQVAGPGPLVVVSAAVGLVAAASADAFARAGIESIGAPLLWIALLLIFLPILWRLLASDAGRGERIGLVVVLGLSLLAIKVLQSPDAFTLYDEILHVRTLNDIERTGRLATPNLLLEVSPLYPGLEVVTDALVRVGGIPIFAAGIAVSAMARALLMLALFLFVEEVTDSPRIAGVAGAVYATNPNFLFFGSQWAYETVALPLLIVVLWLVARRWQRSDERVRLSIVAFAVVAAVVVTHHVSGIALAGVLLLWTLVSMIFRARPAGHGAGALFLLVAILVISWLTYVATLTVGYLAPNLASALRGLLAVIANEVSPRELFRSSSGALAPLWERAIAIASALILTATAFAGSWRLVRHKRPSALTIGLVLVALSYPLVLVFRFSPNGASASGRAVEFIFIGLAVTTAVIGAALWDADLRYRTSRLVVLSLGAVVLLGGVIIGWPESGRLPGTYLVEAGSRSIDDKSIAAAVWSTSALGPERRFVADRVNRTLLSTYGNQDALVPGAAAKIALWPLYFASRLGHAEIVALKDARIEYMLIDRRLSDSTPTFGFYIDPGEFARPKALDPITRAALAKFDGYVGSNRIYDNGSIQIYDVRALSGAP